MGVLPDAVHATIVILMLLDAKKNDEAMLLVQELMYEQGIIADASLYKAALLVCAFGCSPKSSWDARHDVARLSLRLIASIRHHDGVKLSSDMARYALIALCRSRRFRKATALLGSVDEPSMWRAATELVAELRRRGMREFIAAMDDAGAEFIATVEQNSRLTFLKRFE